MKEEFLPFFKILEFFQDHDDSVPFLEPVDLEMYPQYAEVIKHPMDFSTIERKMEKNRYPSPHDFAADMRLVFSNTMHFNLEGSTIYKIAKKFERMFDNRFDKAVLRQGHQKRREAELDGSDLPRKKNNKDKKKTPKKPLTEAQQKHRQEVTKTATTFRELFVQLQSDEMGEVITRIEKECPEAIEIDTNNDSSEEIDINCKDIPLALLEKLNSYCRKKLK